MRILYIEENKTIKEFICVSLETTENVEVIEFSNFFESENEILNPPENTPTLIITTTQRILSSCKVIEKILASENITHFILLKKRK